MANNFSISMAPELEGIETGVTAVGVIVTNIHDVDLPAVQTVVDANEVILTDIHDTDLPAVQTVADANAVILTDLHDTDIPEMRNTIIQSTGTIEAFASEDLLHSNDAEYRSNPAAYIKIKEITCPISGTYRFKFDIQSPGANPTVYGRIYKDGIAHGTEQTHGSASWSTKTEDLAFTAGDLIQLYVKQVAGGNDVMARNFRIYGYYQLGFINVI